MPLLIELSWNIAAQQQRIRVDINDFPIRIGRAVDNDVVLDDLSVSRYHAQISYQDHQLQLLDSGSKYGTLIQDRRVSPHQYALLADRCDLTFGELNVSFKALQRNLFDNPYWSLQNLFVEHLTTQITTQKSYSVVDTFNEVQPSELASMHNSENAISKLSPQMLQWCRQNRLLQQLTLLLQHQDVKQFLSHVIPLFTDAFPHSEITVVDMDAGQSVVVFGCDALLDQYKRLIAVPAVYSQVQNSMKQGQVLAFLPADSSAGETIWCLPVGDCPPSALNIRTLPVFMSQNAVMPSGDFGIQSELNTVSSLLNFAVSEHSGGLSLLLLKTCPEHGYELNEFLPVLQRHLTVLLKQIKQIQKAMRDPLTGVSSRRYIEEKLQSAMLASKRWQHPLAVMFIDIDNFKQINDHYGHAVGDQVLKQVGKRLIDIVANVECVARLGGEEFVVLCNMPITAGSDVVAECDALAQRLLKAFYTVGPSLNYPQLAVTASIGLANFSPQTHQQPYQLIESADMAMYQAKRAGKNRVCWYKAAPNAVMDTQLTQLTQRSSAEVDRKINFTAISMCGNE